MTEFGEAVLYLKAKSKGVDKLDCRWEPGIWLGVLDSTGEVLIGTNEGVIRGRDFRGYTDAEDRWDKSQAMSVVGTPWQPAPGKPEDVVPVRVRFQDEQEQPKPPEEGEKREPVRRRARITKDDIKKFGYTIGCHGCRAISRGSPAENHSEECRARIESELMKAGGQKAKKVQEGQERTSRGRGAEDPFEEPSPSSSFS